jgi:glycosyltransferase involved in cell wall biosynthesis
MNDRAGVSYSEFLSRSAKELLAIPDNAISLLFGIAFLQLGPHVFDKVRQGRAQFELPSEQIYDDLLAVYSQKRRSFVERLHFWTVRNVKQFAFALKCRASWIVVLLTSSRMRGQFIGKSAGTLHAPSGGSRQDTPPPRISIVTLSFNRLAYLRNTLDAVRKTVDQHPYELIVVDNGSEDGSAEFLKEQHQNGLISKVVLLKENHGISAGYNFGFAVADERSDYVMKLDSDIILLSPGWLAEIIDFFSGNGQVGFAALNQVTHPVLRLLPPLRVGGREVMDFGSWPCGSAMIIPKRVMSDIGCFIEDSQLKYEPDDIDYYSRVTRKGYRAFFLRDVLAYHQMHLDSSLYRTYSRGKPAWKSLLLALELARDYDRGDRDVKLIYEKYRNLEMPATGLLVESSTPPLLG